MDIFEKASRLRLNIDTTRGVISFIDLWDLPLTNNREPGFSLDGIAVALSKDLKETGETVSFVNADKRNATAERTQLKFDLVKHVIDIKLAERDKAASAKKRKDDRQRILSIIDEKERDSERNMSVEDLKKLAADMKDDEE